MKAIHIPLLAMSGAGGVRTICALANGLADRGVPVRVTAPSYAAEPPVELEGGVSLDVLAPRGDSRVGYMLRLVRTLRRSEGVIVSTGYLTPALIALARPAQARMFSLIQGVETESHIRYGRRPAPVKPVLHALARLGYRIPGYKVAVSNFVADAVGRRWIDEVINPGIDNGYIDRIPDDRAVRPRHERLRVGLLATPGEVKGLRYALEALGQLREALSPVDAVAYDVDHPGGDLPPFVERYSSGAPEPEHSVAAFLGGCDVFVFPSLYEGFGLPPLEAMACGAAVVMTDSGGVRDYAEDGGNALVVPPGDPGAIADAVTRLARDETLRRRLARAGYETARRFPRTRFVDACCAPLVRLLESGA